MKGRAEETFDVIVVLGGPEAAMRRRTEHAVDLLNRGRAAHLILSGGVVRGRTECEIMREAALAAGADTERIVLERRSRNTLENAVCTRTVMARRGWTRALIVTDRLHVPRALLSFRAAGVRAKGSGVPPGAGDSFVWVLYGAGYEVLGLAWYALSVLTGRHRRMARDLAAEAPGNPGGARP